ncbi:peptidase inhibitor family I36 protein [Nonomuraea sp. SBT364]|uniref:peptidase inhibitor family I36 protein n=1 Tax=Nonomuraea sp. SBT364 TaxID=1580530 RepID=UPI00066E0043|nr:peptidase inhibitor family I36 protein [Nonomuraea sp. SBT364]
MKPTIRRIAAGAAVSAVMLAALSVPAAAEPNPSGCPKGNFCLWYEGQDKPFWSSAGNMTEPVGTWNGDTDIRAFNNGNPQTGVDHVRIYWHYKYFGTPDRGGETLKVTCLHYNPGPGTYKTTIGTGSSEKVVHIHKAVWGPEC